MNTLPLTVDELRELRAAANDQINRLNRKGFVNQSNRLNDISRKLGAWITENEPREVK